MYSVYLMANKPFGVLYLGQTSDLSTRAWEHRNKIMPGFSSDYNTTLLVWYELHESRESAFKRERQMKSWKRQWKLDLICENNPNWDDLSEEFLA